MPDPRKLVRLLLIALSWLLVLAVWWLINGGAG